MGVDTVEIEVPFHQTVRLTNISLAYTNIALVRIGTRYCYYGK